MKKHIYTLLLISSISTSQAALVSLYEFEGNLLDSSGNGNTLTDTGTGSVGLTATGVFGTAAQFDGVNDKLTASVNINNSAIGDVTFGAWVNADTSSTIQTFLSHDNGGYDRTLNIDSRGGSGFAAFTGSGVLNSNINDPGNWHFVAATYDSDNVNLYVDGNMITANDNTDNGSGWNNFTIGTNPSFNEYFGGLLDNVFIFDEALSLTQLDDIYTYGKSSIFEIGGIQVDAGSEPMPEPSILALMGLGIFGLGMTRRKMK